MQQRQQEQRDRISAQLANVGLAITVGLVDHALELANVGLAIAITVGLVDHVLELLLIDVLAELLSHADEVAEGDLVGVVVIEQKPESPPKPESP